MTVTILKDGGSFLGEDKEKCELCGDYVNAVMICEDCERCADCCDCDPLFSDGEDDEDICEICGEEISTLNADGICAACHNEELEDKEDKGEDDE